MLAFKIMVNNLLSFHQLHNWGHTNPICVLDRNPVFFTSEKNLL